MTLDSDDRPGTTATEVGDPPHVGGRIVVSVSGLSKSYGEVEAVRGIDFEVAAGETFGFLGPNGAGKTTTIKILCTLARPTSGSARVAGYDVVGERDEVRRNIGLVFQDTTLDSYLTAAQNLRFHADLYSVPKAAVGPRMRQVLDMVGLWDRRDSLVSTYSGGMQRRLEIARGLLNAPYVLFLDEPTVGLDPQTRSSIWQWLRTGGLPTGGPGGSDRGSPGPSDYGPSGPRSDKEPTGRGPTRSQRGGVRQGANGAGSGKQRKRAGRVATGANHPARDHRRSDGGPERRHRCSDGGPEHRN